MDGEKVPTRDLNVGADDADVLVVEAVLLADLVARLAVDEARLGALAVDAIEPDRDVLRAAELEIRVAAKGEAELAADDFSAVVVVVKDIVADGAPLAAAEDLDAAGPEVSAGAADAVHQAKRVEGPLVDIVAMAICKQFAPHLRAQHPWRCTGHICRALWAEAGSEADGLSNKLHDIVRLSSSCVSQGFAATAYCCQGKRLTRLSPVMLQVLMDTSTGAGSMAHWAHQAYYTFISQQNQSAGEDAHQTSRSLSRL
jgi:hypothetical protein